MLASACFPPCFLILTFLPDIYALAVRRTAPEGKCVYHIVQNSGGENFGKFGESEAICQSFTHPNLHFRKLHINIVDYQKIHWAKIHTMSILKYFCPLREKPDLPDPSGLLRETVPPTAIVAANVKVIDALNEAELKRKVR